MTHDSDQLMKIIQYDIEIVLNSDLLKIDINQYHSVFFFCYYMVHIHRKANPQQQFFALNQRKPENVYINT